MISMDRSRSPGTVGPMSVEPHRVDSAMFEHSMASAVSCVGPARNAAVIEDNAIYMSGQRPSSSSRSPRSPRPTTPPPGTHAPPSPTREQLTHRLHVLLDEVVSVIRSYSAMLNPSARRVHALHSFYDRIYDLLHPPSPDLFAMDVDAEPSGGTLGRGMTPSHVERLEREWWESEVVAAWYGPAPALNAVRSSLPNRASFSVADGVAPSPSPGEEDRRGQVQPGEAGLNVKATTLGREDAINRDASYVGLYDE